MEISLGPSNLSLLSELKCFQVRSSREAFEWLGDAFLKAVVEKCLLNNAQGSQRQVMDLVDTAVCNTNLAQAFDGLGIAYLCNSSKKNFGFTGNRAKKRKLGGGLRQLQPVAVSEDIAVKTKADYFEAVLGELVLVANTEGLQRFALASTIEKLVNEVFRTQYFKEALEDDGKVKDSSPGNAQSFHLLAYSSDSNSEDEVPENNAHIQNNSDADYEYKSKINVLTSSESPTVSSTLFRSVTDNYQGPKKQDSSLAAFEISSIGADILKAHVSCTNSFMNSKFNSNFSSENVQQLEHFGSALLTYHVSQLLVNAKVLKDKTPCNLTRVRQRLLATPRLKAVAKFVLLKQNPVVQCPGMSAVLKNLYPRHIGCCLETRKTGPCSGILLRVLRLVLGNCGSNLCNSSGISCALPFKFAVVLLTSSKQLFAEGTSEMTNFAQEAEVLLKSSTPNALHLEYCFNTCQPLSLPNHINSFLRKTKHRKRKRQAKCVLSLQDEMTVKLQHLDGRSRSLLERLAVQPSVQKMERLLLTLCVKGFFASGTHNQQRGGLSDCSSSEDGETNLVPQHAKHSQSPNIGELLADLKEAGVLAVENAPLNTCAFPQKVSLVCPSGLHRRLLHVLCTVHNLHSSSKVTRNGEKAVLVQFKEDWKAQKNKGVLVTEFLSTGIIKPVF